MSEEKVFIKTRGAIKAMQSLDRIRDEKIIGMVIGRAGFGKTFPIKAWLRRQTEGFRYFWIEADVLTSPRPILDCFTRALGLGQNSGTASTLFYTKRRIAEALARDPVMAIIGQADMLSVPRAFELLRAIWDEVSSLRDTDGESGFPLALFGTPKLSESMAREDLEPLRRRVFHHAILPGLSRKELETILQTKWPGFGYPDESVDQILRLSQGSFGWVNDIMKIATLIASKNGCNISAAVLRETQKELIGLPDEDS
jgi:type II secretory pathway predicted ATPase ExeA